MNILNKLTIKHLLMNKKRTIVSIIGVILSTALMVGIGLLFSSMRDNSIKMTIYQNGPQHVILKDVRADKLDILKKNVKVKSVSYTKNIGYGNVPVIKDRYKPFVQVLSASSDFFETLVLKEGRLPQNDNEIVLPEQLKHMDGIPQIGENWTITLGEKETFSFEEETDDYEDWLKENHILNGVSKTYKVVGIIECSYIQMEDAYQVITLDNLESSGLIDAYIIYKNPKDAFTLSEVLAQNIGMEKNEIAESLDYNTSLLSLYGASKYDNFTSSMARVISIILFLVSIGCIIVIYNSFAISVMERKKQFGLFSSIGATKTQLRKTVFFEAFIIGIIGIPLGIISAFIGIGTVIYIVNLLLPDAFTVPLALSVYPLFIWIPIFFMVVVILISAYLPASKASKITPIEAIRQNDDIKMKSKKLKTHKWVRKFFGIEGELALKNMKRNKRKYRITIVSLFISIVLFISFSGIVYYGFTSMIEYVEYPEFDIMVSVSDRDPKKMDGTLDPIKNHSQVEKYIQAEYESFITTDINLSHYDSKFVKKTKLDLPEQTTVTLYGLDTKSYQEFKKEIGLKEDLPIIINQYKGVLYANHNRTSVNMKKYSRIPDTISLCVEDFNQENSTEVTTLICNQTLGDYYMTEKYPFGFDIYLNLPEHMMVIMSQDMLDQYHGLELKEAAGSTGLEYTKNAFIKASKYNDLSKKLNELQEDSSVSSFDYMNVKEEMRFMSNLILVVKILLYGFITLVTLIGVTSVFNTINTSMNLRRKEFAMLRSMGLTPKGFNKILAFESLFFGLKSLLYGIPVSIAVVYLLYLAFGGVVEQKFVLPWQSIGIAIFGIFVIVYITMKYASSKIKKENILDAIREENI